MVKKQHAKNNLTQLDFCGVIRLRRYDGKGKSMTLKIPLVTTSTGIHIGLLYTQPRRMTELDLFWQDVLLRTGGKNA
jgi:hypothetical protein